LFFILIISVILAGQIIIEVCPYKG